MRFSLFVHMERTSPDQDQQELYENFIALAKIADEGGMHAVWTGEHHGMDFTISPNPFLNIVDLARQTRNVRLGTGTVVAPFWHPIRLAGEAAMTDMITEGRLDLGIARGAYSYEYERMLPGMDAWEAGQRMRELVPALHGLWAGDYAQEGEFHSFPATTSSPKPRQAGGPPIWVAARDPNSHEFGVHNGFNIQVTPLWQGMDEIDGQSVQPVLSFFETSDISLPVQKGDGHALQVLYLEPDFVQSGDISVELPLSRIPTSLR